MTDWQPHVLEFAPTFPWEGDPLKILDRTATMAFLERHKDKFKGRVLDYGCGKFSKPEDLRYRKFVLGCGAEHVPWDPFNAREWCAETAKEIGAGAGCFDTVLCVQVLSESEQPIMSLLEIQRLLKSDGFLVLTYTTCWRQVDLNDKWWYTHAGMENLIRRHTNFQVVEHVKRAEVRVQNFAFCLGGGIVLRKP